MTKKGRKDEMKNWDKQLQNEGIKIGRRIEEREKQRKREGLIDKWGVLVCVCVCIYICPDFQDVITHLLFSPLHRNHDISSQIVKTNYIKRLIVYLLYRVFEFVHIGSHCDWSKKRVIKGEKGVEGWNEEVSDVRQEEGR